MKKIFGIIVLAIFMICNTFGQNVAVKVTGTVYDVSGAIVPNWKVSLTTDDGYDHIVSRGTKYTGNDGTYVWNLTLPAGSNYSLIFKIANKNGDTTTVWADAEVRVSALIVTTDLTIDAGIVATSISEVSTLNKFFYSDNTITIKTNTYKNTLNVYNLNGQLVLTNAFDNEMEVNISNLTSGIYVAKLNDKTLKFQK